MHPSGIKADYAWRVTAPDRAMQAGVDDVGIGVLFGLYDYRFEILGLLAHIRHLEAAHGCGPHTISVPRLEPAEGSEVAINPPHPVSDDDFKKIVAIQETFALGVSQISAGSRTNPGGYAQDETSGAQFQLGDHRDLDAVIADVVRMGYVPSFCTGCYRKGRTGGDFMDLAKPGSIKHFCLPNAILTFQEYLEDYASPETRLAGIEAIQRHLADIPTARRRSETEKRLDRVRAGERDLYF